MIMFAKELTKMFICGRQIRQYNDQTDKVASFKGSQVEIRGFGQMQDVIGRSQFESDFLKSIEDILCPQTWYSISL